MAELMSIITKYQDELKYYDELGIEKLGFRILYEEDGFAVKLNFFSDKTFYFSYFNLENCSNLPDELLSLSKAVSESLISISNKHSEFNKMVNDYIKEARKSCIK